MVAMGVQTVAHYLLEKTERPAAVKDGAVK